MASCTSDPCACMLQGPYLSSTQAGHDFALLACFAFRRIFRLKSRNAVRHWPRLSVPFTSQFLNASFPKLKFRVAYCFHNFSASRLVIVSYVGQIASPHPFPSSGIRYGSLAYANPLIDPWPAISAPSSGDRPALLPLSLRRHDKELADQRRAWVTIGNLSSCRRTTLKSGT
jgi:hypothetical protein